ncbi:hypothetical protein EGH21_21975 [Halomicroarcula sp. F13]|uniref:Halobacterial output domain-containing protein n=1 Tax=Haloarcula rubra TaxID=2487747 RepID=A0AAW4PYG1_9EURY|nr:hypothetical protein [Halomicroarcula rubra]MBX0325689.1 hypothetical protein [Halomicroarcula rubra]
MQRDHTRDEILPAQVTLHVGAELELLDRACHAPRSTELVVAPVELHQRNVQRRLREARAPKDAFEFDDPVGLSRDVLRASDASTAAIDRIDRLTLVRAILDESASASPTVSLPVGTPSGDPQYVEQIRTDVERATNFHPERVAAWDDAAGELDAPIDADTAALLETALDVERALRARTEEAVSETELVRRATRDLAATDGAAWAAAYPEIRRLSLVGLSSVSAALADLLHALVATTTLEVHVYFREGTGAYLEGRFPSLLGVEDPGLEVFE